MWMIFSGCERVLNLSAEGVGNSCHLCRRDLSQLKLIYHPMGLIFSDLNLSLDILWLPNIIPLCQKNVLDYFY